MNIIDNSVSPIENDNSRIETPVNIHRKSFVKKIRSEELLINDHMGITKHSLLIILPLSFRSLGIIFGDM